MLAKAQPVLAIAKYSASKPLLQRARFLVQSAIFHDASVGAMHANGKSPLLSSEQMAGDLVKRVIWIAPMRMSRDREKRRSETAIGIRGL